MSIIGRTVEFNTGRNDKYKTEAVVLDKVLCASEHSGDIIHKYMIQITAAKTLLSVGEIHFIFPQLINKVLPITPELPTA